MDEWEENLLGDDDFLDLAVRMAEEAEEALASRNQPQNPNHNPTPTPHPYPNPNPPRQDDHFAASAPLFIRAGDAPLPAAALADRFSPPRELSQRPPPPPRTACSSERDVAGSFLARSDDRFGRDGGTDGRREREREKEVERLTRELYRVSKQLNHLENECMELEKDRREKDQQLKRAFEKIEAKDAEIHNLKKEDVAHSRQDLRSPQMHIDQPSGIPPNEDSLAGGAGLTSGRTVRSNGKHSDAINYSRDYSCPNQKYQINEMPEVLELKHRTMIDNSLSTSGGVTLMGSTCLEEKGTRSKGSKAIGVQTDFSDRDNFQCNNLPVELVSSKLRAIWVMPTSCSVGRGLTAKILVSCSEEFFALFRSTTLPENGEKSSGAGPCINDAVSRLYGIFIKMHTETTPIHTLLEALLNLCAVGNAIVIGRALRIFQSVLQHLLNWETMSKKRNNVFVEPYVTNIMHKVTNDRESSSTLMGTAENLLNSCCGFREQCTFPPIALWCAVFKAMLQVAVKHSEESIRVNALSIMILIVMRSDPKEREKFGFTCVIESLHQLLQKEVGLAVRKRSVYLLFLLLNCPKMLALFCNGGKDGAEQPEKIGCENDRLQQAIGSLLEDLSNCLTCGASGSLELNLHRQVIILLAYMASNGKLGYEVLLAPVTPHCLNFLELITRVLASQIEAETADSAEAQDQLKDRYLLMREALIILNRLVSHPTFSKPTLEVLTNSKSCGTLTIHIANRLPQKMEQQRRQVGARNPQMEAEIADLARMFRTKVYAFLEERHPVADRSIPR